MDWSLDGNIEPTDYTNWTDEDIATTIAALTAETHRRAVANNNPEAVAADIYNHLGFTPTGDPRAPWITEGGLLVAVGAKHTQSSTRHRCTFICVDGEWAWNHPNAIYDQMRTTDISGKPVLQSVTLLPAIEGTTVDVIASAANRGPCQAQHTTSYQIRSGVLTYTRTATRTPGAHR